MKNIPLENNINKIKEEIASILCEIGFENDPGSILYSADSTLKKGKYYFLGENPGGHSDEGSEKHADNILNQLYRKNSSPSFNEYFDARWKPGNTIHSPGMAPLQKRIKFLFDYLEINLRNTLSTNLNFVRSNQMKNFPYNKNQAAERCWKIHKLLLSTVQPATILVFGSNAYEFIQKKMNIEVFEDIDIYSIGDKQRKRFSCSQGSLLLDNIELNNLQLVKVPHLSYLKIDSNGMDYGDAHDTREVLKWLKGKVA